MKHTVTFTGKLNGKIQLPASKSISNRALILKALSGSPYNIQNLSDCDDTRAMISAFSSKNKTIDIGAAGTAMRFLTAYLSVQDNGSRNIAGTERMKNRPIRILVEALRSLGAKIDYLEKEGFPPLHIEGSKLKGGTIDLDGNVSSQYVSALMMIAPVMSEGLTLRLKGDVISKPYIRMTLRMMKTFGVQVDWKEKILRIEPQNYKPCTYTVEGDWSAASYWYEMALLKSGESEIELLGLYKNSIQGDAKVAELFEQLGVSTEFTDQGAILRSHPAKEQKTTGVFEYDFVNEPDLAQTFVVACSLKNIPFRFIGLRSLKIKETDRIAALQNEMKKLGYIVRERNDNQLEWTSERIKFEPFPAIDVYEDHRMAMAFAPAAIVFGKIDVNDPSVVSKSYPRFWEDLKTVGFNIE